MTPGTHIDRYEVVRLLGEGGMARVYLVEHRTLKTQHALKVLNHTHPSVRERLIQEGQLQARLRHPNIVAVTDVLEVEGQPALLMELVEGPTLEVELWERRGQPRSLDEALELFEAICSGVEAAHELQVVHRDIKPANILLAADGPKVTDFGLAKTLAEGQGSGHTRTGSTMGTPAYMAPEQIRDTKNVDERADVFALGAVLYELVCGVRAFQGEDVLELMNAVARGDFVPPRERVPSLPKAVARSIEAALVVQPEHRLGSVTELRAAVRGERPIRPRPPVLVFPDGRVGTVAPSTPKGPPPRSLSADPLPPADSLQTLELRAEPQPASPPSRWPRRLAAGGGLSLLTLGVGAVLLWEPEVDLASDAVETEQPALEQPVLEQPVLEQPVLEQPVLEQPVLEQPSVEVSAPRTPRPRVEPAIDAEPPLAQPAPEPARFGFQGADSVELRDGSTAFEPGAVPPGDYTIVAVFGDRQVEAGVLKLDAGQVVTIRCDADFMTCSR
jgi:serine/threonine protein kinase